MTDALETSFAQALARLGPFESRPTLAVAVSGGADSMALCLLAQQWVAARQGKLIALTVDHALRPESAAEARQVADWLTTHGIEHHILCWEHETLDGNRQMLARQARYGLMSEWCRKHGILHLLTGHHLDDQAETLLMREARKSGAQGLAAMPAISYLDGVQLLRPLLGISKLPLMLWLQSQGQMWLEDPSNQSDVYDRNRLRKAMPEMDSSAEELAQQAQDYGKQRAALETQTATWLARSVSIFPEGHAWLQRDRLAKAPREIQLRALTALISCIDGDDYPPRHSELVHLYENWFAAGATSNITLGRCLFAPSRKRGKSDSILICRETGQIASPQTIEPGKPLRWDRRWSCILSGKIDLPSLSIRPLSTRECEGTLPKPVLYALPSLWSLETLLLAPHIHYRNSLCSSLDLTIRFTPRRPLAGAAFYCAGSMGTL